MQSLFLSRKFKAAVLDAFFATLTIVLTWFLAPDKVSQALILIGIWQPVVVAYVLGTAYEDGQAKANAAPPADQPAAIGFTQPDAEDPDNPK